MRTILFAFALFVSAPSVSWAEPLPGRAFPTFSVDDIAGTHHNERDLTGRVSVLLVMTDKDTGPAMTAWYRRISTAAPAARVLSVVALSLFALIPTSTVISQAREATPRHRWNEVWLSRNGSLAESLGLPESETPWVFVIDASGRVIEAVHGPADDAGVARITAALGSRPASAQR